MTAIEMIQQERERQAAKGYTPEHDDEHDLGELALAAALYALPYDAEIAGQPLLSQSDHIGLDILLATGMDFDLQPEPNKLRRLVKAGAMIVAEIERLGRIENGADDK